MTQNFTKVKKAYAGWSISLQLSGRDGGISFDLGVDTHPTFHMYSLQVNLTKHQSQFFLFSFTDSVTNTLIHISIIGKAMYGDHLAGRERSERTR